MHLLGWSFFSNVLITTYYTDMVVLAITLKPPMTEWLNNKWVLKISALAHSTFIWFQSNTLAVGKTDVLWHVSSSGQCRGCWTKDATAKTHAIHPMLSSVCLPYQSYTKATQLHYTNCFDIYCTLISDNRQITVTTVFRFLFNQTVNDGAAHSNI